jgi:hypothetical protein
MAKLVSMPPIAVSQSDLALFGAAWGSNGGRLRRTPPQSSSQLGNLFDEAVGKALAKMLGDVPVVKSSGNSLVASLPDCVEVGPVRVIGGVRPQNFDVGYRPDGVRFAFDSKTLNDTESVGKNWQNMVNDLATEAATVHSRFPYAVVAFMVIIPVPCLAELRRSAITETLERLARRTSVRDPDYLSEAASLVLWNPSDGTIDQNFPSFLSPLRIEKFSAQVEAAYTSRYKGFPPHATAE